MKMDIDINENLWQNPASKKLLENGRDKYQAGNTALDYQYIILGKA